MSGSPKAGCPTFSIYPRMACGSVAMVSSAIFSNRPGQPWASAALTKSASTAFLSMVGIHTTRATPPSAFRNLRLPR
jgi:hypothetical protein